ncbi:MAG: hypothetical protein KF782_31875, partial [Labilithrix sp.]|nr:hypothetical protein [Labilithrix sp.]
MIGSRVLGAACAAILISSLGTLAGCGTADEKTEGATAQTIQAASVSLVLHDANGTRVGEGSGILIAPRVVLTSGHLIAGMARWTVTSADGKTKVNGVRGMTYDWMNYNSDLSHPRKHDVGVIYLDRPIQLAAYPTLSEQRVAASSKGSRVRGTGSSFEMLPATFDRFKTFPHAFITDLNPGETLDTGGAVVNEKNEIIGLVTGRGHTTGKLHIARVDDLVSWLSPKVSCGHKSAKALSTRTYGTPPPKPGCEDDGNGTSSGGSSGSSGDGSSGSSGSSGDGSSGSSGSSGDGSSGSSGSSGG